MERSKHGLFVFPPKKTLPDGKALLDISIVWPKDAIDINANLVKPIKPLIPIPPLLLICQQTALSNDELLVLSRGLTFCPTPKLTNLADYLLTLMTSRDSCV